MIKRFMHDTCIELLVRVIVHPESKIFELKAGTPSNQVILPESTLYGQKFVIMQKGYL